MRLFRRLKSGDGRRTSEYRMTTPEVLAALRSHGEILWENRRYNAIYATDRPELIRMLEAGFVPVVHVGQAEAIQALQAEPVSWTTVALTCPRDVAMQRIVDRATGDTAARMAAWDESDTLTSVDLHLDTSACSPQEAAVFITAAMSSNVS
jgi:guanylate kinase